MKKVSYLDKNTLRLQVLSQLEALPRQLHQQKSKLLASLLFETIEWKNATNIGVTISNYPEVDTSFLIEEAKKQNKRIFVPKCFSKNKEMKFYEWNDETKFERKYANILEPIIDTTKQIHKNDINLLIVPGVVYSKEGYRIGFGGGYYDRFLVGFNGPTVSLVFQEQLKERIPLDIYDLPVQKMIIL